MDCEKWAIPHGEKIYELSEITVGIERAFVNYAKQRLLADNAEWDDPAGHSEYRSYLSAGNEFWNEGGLSAGVLGIFRSEEGAKHLVKLCLGFPKKTLPEAEFQALYETLNNTESPLSLAWNQVILKRFPTLAEGPTDPKKSATNPATSDLTGSTNS